MGRLLTIVETRDTGPLSIAQNNSTAAITTSVSLKMSRAMAEFRRFILLNSLRARGRNEASRKIPDILNMLMQYIFQKEIWARPYLAATFPTAISKLEPSRRKNAFPGQVVEPLGVCLVETIAAPATTTITAIQSR